MDNLKRVREALEMYAKLGDDEDGATILIYDEGKRAKEALKELDRFMESNGWQDIESAPKEDEELVNKVAKTLMQTFMAQWEYELANNELSTPYLDGTKVWEDIAKAAIKSIKGEGDE